MLYTPDYILDFGSNKGYSLAQVYYYLPSYIEWLIEHIQDCQIDVNEFYKLGKSVATMQERDGIFRIMHQPPNGKVKNIINLPNKNKREIDYRFSDKALKILDLKAHDNYIAPKYITPAPTPFEKNNLKRKRKL